MLLLRRCAASPAAKRPLRMLSVEDHRLTRLQGGWSSESVSHGCIGHDTEADWHQSAPGTAERRLLALEVILDETQRTD